MLHDQDTVAAFLMKLANQDEVLPLSSFVVAACREFGWTAFAQELKQLLASHRKNTGERIFRCAMSNGLPRSAASLRPIPSTQFLRANYVKSR